MNEKLVQLFLSNNYESTLLAFSLEQKNCKQWNKWFNEYLPGACIYHIYAVPIPYYCFYMYFKGVHIDLNIPRQYILRS